MVYYVARDRLGVLNAAGKAPADIDFLCRQRGWTPLYYPEVKHWKHTLRHRVYRALLVLKFWTAVSKSLHQGDIVFYQHPVSYGSKIAFRFVRQMQRNGVKFVALIHDLNTLRFGLLFSDLKKTNVHFEDGTFLPQFDVIICHNARMKAYLMEQGVPEEKLICLELFDYLLPSGIPSSNTSADGVAIAGNLLPKKSGYLYELAKLSFDFPVNLYGVNYDGGLNPNGTLAYKGSFDPDVLPAALAGKYGIVWDGSSIDTCDGASGNYLRYNNPHKLSLYMASGIPVITWKEAAIAEFVHKYGVGITVSTLRELPEALGVISETQYDEMKDNIRQIQKQVCSGYYFNRAIDSALKIIRQV